MASQGITTGIGLIGSLIGSGIGSAVGTAVGTGIGFGTATALQPFMNMASQQLNKLIQQEIFDPSTLATLKIRSLVTDEDYYEQFNKHGLTKQKADQYLAGSKHLQGIEDIIIRYRRTLIDKKTAILEAQEIGIDPAIFEKMLKSSEYIYTPQDLIVFMVREVFNPQIRKLYEQDADFPESAYKEFDKIGISKELALDYWAAHWKLPSIEQGFEMMFRYRPEDKEFWEKEAKEIGLDVSQLSTTQEDMRSLLKTNDTMKFWREKTLGIAFRPLTLRMLQQQVRLRILDRKNTEYQYRKMGYSNQDAKNNTSFSFLYESLGDWQEMLKNSQITESDIRSEMNEWGVPQKIQDTIWTRKLEPVTESQVTKEKEISVVYLKKGFQIGKINRDEVLAGLKLLKYAEKTSKFMIEIWALEMEDTSSKPKLLSKAEHLKQFSLGIDDEQQTENNLRAIGYTIEAAKELIFLQKVKDKIAEATQ